MSAPAHRDNPAGPAAHSASDRAQLVHRDLSSSSQARDDVERAIALLRPFIEQTILDRDVSPDQALVIVVVDPGASPETAFEDAILSIHPFGSAGRTEVDYSRHALDKARTSSRERCDTSVVRERGSALLTADLPLVGGVHRHGWTLGVSGAVACFDEAIGAIVIDLLHAIETQHSPRSGAVS
jgi:hypothetical protein